MFLNYQNFSLIFNIYRSIWAFDNPLPSQHRDMDLRANGRNQKRNRMIAITDHRCLPGNQRSAGPLGKGKLRTIRQSGRLWWWRWSSILTSKDTMLLILKVCGAFHPCWVSVCLRTLSYSLMLLRSVKSAHEVQAYTSGLKWEFVWKAR